MRNHKHNLMALFLAAAILLSTLSLNLTALADSSIKLDCSGGQLSGSVTLNAGDALPNYEQITKAGYTFGGWYTTPNYSGLQSFAAEANTTYYARWVEHNVNGVDFEDVANDADLATKFNYAYRGSNTVALNTDGVNVYDGTKSLYIKLIDWTGFDSVNALDFSNQDAYLWWDSADKVVDGYCFWISTSKEVTFEWMNAWSTIATVTVPAGKHILTIPKTNNGFLYNAKFRFKKGNDTDIYIDSIGSFTDTGYQSSVVLNPCGGTLDPTFKMGADGLLPNYEKITKEGYTFGGWYATPDYSGSQVFVAEADTTYYARWVEHNVNGVDFEDVANDTDLAAKFNYRYKGSNTVALNTDGVNVYDGTKSLYIKLIDWTGFDSVNALDFSNQDAYPWWSSADEVVDGYCFWISTTKEVTFEWHNQWSSIATITVPAGKHIVTIPKTNNGFLYNAKFRIKKGNNTEIYIDSIGSFTSAFQSSVVLEKSGGTLAPTVRVKPGDLLPNYEKITKAGYTFGGWYATPDYSGSQVFTAEADTTYYARWVEHNVNAADFEELANDTDLAAKFNYNYRGSNTVALNTDGVNVYDGTKSLYIKLINWSHFDGTNAVDFSNQDAYLWWDSADKVVDGYCFWVSTSKEITFEWMNAWSTIATVTVPAGKHILTIPKTNNGFLYNAKLRFKKGNDTNIYIDSIGSFTSADYQSSVVLNPCGGTLDSTVKVNSGDILPNYEKITKDGFIFGGWYKNSDYSGSRAFTAETDKTYYARWINAKEYEDLDLADQIQLAASEKIEKSIPTTVDDGICLTFVAPAQGVKLGLNGVCVVLDGQNSSVAFGNNTPTAINVADAADDVYDVTFIVHDTSTADADRAAVELTVNGELYCITLNGASLADGQNNVCIENISSVAVSVEAGAISLADNDDFALIGNILYTDHAVTLSDVKNALDDESKFTFSDGAVKTGYSFARNNKALTGNYSVAVKGDINADGNINVSDLVRLKKAAANTVTLSDAQALAATFGENESIGAKHLVNVRELLLGI